MTLTIEDRVEWLMKNQGELYGVLNDTILRRRIDDFMRDYIDSSFIGYKQRETYLNRWLEIRKGYET